MVWEYDGKEYDGEDGRIECIMTILAYDPAAHMDFIVWLGRRYTAPGLYDMMSDYSDDRVVEFQDRLWEMFAGDVMNDDWLVSYGAVWKEVRE